jgi:hypothetical protein
MRWSVHTANTDGTYGLDDQAKSATGVFRFWIWLPGDDTTRLSDATYVFESDTSPVLCKVKNDCLRTVGSPTIPIFPFSP